MIEVLHAFSESLSLGVIFNVGLGTVIGIIVGALPGLTATMAVALAVPLTFGQTPLMAFAMVLGLYSGAMYGGSIPAILLKTPGTPAASATILDGYPMAQKGEAGLAIGISTIASAVGGLISILILIFLAPQLARFGLKFSAQEFFGLAMFGLTIIIGVSSGSTLKGLISGVIGLLAASVGIDEITGCFRFTANYMELYGGISFVPVMIGLFALSEVFTNIRTDQHRVGAGDFSVALPSLKLINELKWTILRSSLIGTFIGVLPGAGGGIGSFLSYNEAKRNSKNPDSFGEGNPHGVAAAESANNAVVGGALVPLLTLAIPGDSVTAILLGAFLIHGLRPGPMLFVESKNFVLGLYILLILAQLVMLVVGLIGAKFFSRILLVSNAIVQPIIIILAIVGSYAVNNCMFDVFVMIGSGLLGYVLKTFKYPLVPVVLGLILGPMAETNFRRALILSNGNYSTFFTRPISALLLAATALFLVVGFAREHRMAKKAATPSAS